MKKTLLDLISFAYFILLIIFFYLLFKNAIEYSPEGFLASLKIISTFGIVFLSFSIIYSIAIIILNFSLEDSALNKVFTLIGSILFPGILPFIVYITHLREKIVFPAQGSLGLLNQAPKGLKT